MDEKQTYYRMIGDLWKYMKTHLPATGSEAWAKSVYEGAKTFADNHGNTKFAQELVAAAMWELDRLAKGE